MNKAKVGPHERNIENGDFVIIDAENRDPQDRDYVVSVIDDCANIKKFQYDPSSHQVALIAESSDEYFPIILHESDNFQMLGKVLDVIKSFRKD